MKVIRIEYPEECQLEGWDKAVFETRIKQTFTSFFSICEVDRCRKTILGLQRDPDAYDELNVFHCESFEHLRSDDVQNLVEKTARYIGVKLVVQDTKLTRRPIMLVTSAALAAVAVIALVVHPKAVQPTPHAASSVASVPYSPPIGPIPETPPDAIFTATVRATSAAAAAKSLASAVMTDDGEYDVSLTVTPVTHPRPVDVEPIQPHEAAKHATTK